MMCGGTSNATPADEETQQVIDEVKQEVEAKLRKKLPTYKAVQVARQLVAGTNFFVKVDIGNQDFIHIRVYKKLPCYESKIELHGMQTGKSADDKVAYFQGFWLPPNLGNKRIQGKSENFIFNK